MASAMSESGDDLGAIAGGSVIVVTSSCLHRDGGDRRLGAEHKGLGGLEIGLDSAAEDRTRR
jgi:hypothetical protein